MATSDISKGPRLPYDGLFGDSNLIRIIRQVIADPFTKYRPIDLEILTRNRAPTVRESLRILTSLGLLMRDESDRQHPVYRVNTESKRYLALTFLAYAVLDDWNGTDCMDDIVADYYNSSLREKYKPCEIDTMYTLSQSLGVTWTYPIEQSELLGEPCPTLLTIGGQPHGATYNAATSVDTVKPIHRHPGPKSAAVA